MKAWKTVLLVFALLAPATALATGTPAPEPSAFSRLWTGWGSVNRDAMAREEEAVQRVREDVSTANAARMRQLQSQGRALGERVGEIVRLGDCEDGERVAREAGDFALVQAVRDYCERRESAAQSD